MNKAQFPFGRWGMKRCRVFFLKIHHYPIKTRYPALETRCCNVAQQLLLVFVSLVSQSDKLTDDTNLNCPKNINYIFTITLFFEKSSFLVKCLRCCTNFTRFS